MIVIIRIKFKLTCKLPCKCLPHIAKIEYMVTCNVNEHYDHWCANVMLLFNTGYYGDRWLATAADGDDDGSGVILW